MTLDEFVSFSAEPVSVQQSVSSEQEESKEGDMRMKSISPSKGQAKQQKENVNQTLMQLIGDE